MYLFFLKLLIRFKMASFESKAVKQSSAPQEVQKFSLQRLEISVKKFIKVITIDIDRLQQHRINVEKVQFNLFYIIFGSEIV